MIIQADIKHLDDLVFLFDQYMMFYKKKSGKQLYRQYLKERLLKNEATVYIAYQSEKHAVGFALVYHTFSSISLGKILILNDLYVLNEERKKGIGEQLLQKTIELGRQNGAVKINLETTKDNEIAQNLYRKVGFLKDEAFDTFSYDIEKNRRNF